MPAAFDAPNELSLLRALVHAHSVPDPRDGTRQAILYLRFNDSLYHHALGADTPPVDEALVNEMNAKGLITIGYGAGADTLELTPTPLGRSAIEAEDRSHVEESPVDVGPVLAAIINQAAAENPLGWPAVRPVLAALRGHWRDAGYSEHGVLLLPIARKLPDDTLPPLFAATIRSLAGGGYLKQGALSGALVDEAAGFRVSLPLEVVLTDRAHAILDGWPGAPPTELVDNLLAVLVETAEHERDPTKKRRIEAVVDAIREVGVSITSEVIAKVVTGGIR